MHNETVFHYKKEILSFVTKWVELEITTLNEISQAPKDN
jgi:hypothetical protein